jgi:hypothetical protein
MLPDDLKTDVLELAAIAKDCPEGFRDKCFELLLTHYLRHLETRAPKTEPVNRSTEPEPPEPKEPDVKQKQQITTEAPPGPDLTLKDLHVKAKKFLEKYEKTIDDLNQIFYKEGDEYRPLFEDLKTTKTAESQIRIALLQALVSGIKSGDFQFDGEAVRKECQIRKCYDAGNFSTNFKNSAGLFDGFEKYEKQSPIIKLSEDGRKALAQVISELG